MITGFVLGCFAGMLCTALGLYVGIRRQQTRDRRRRVREVLDNVSLGTMVN